MPRRPIQPLARLELPLDVPPDADWRIAVTPQGVILASAFWTVRADGAVPARRAELVGCTLQGDVQPIEDTAGEGGTRSGQQVVAEVDPAGHVYLFDAEVSAPLHKFGPAGSPLGYFRVRMLDPQADLAVLPDGTLWWCAAVPELPVQRFDGSGDPLPAWRPTYPPQVGAFLPHSLAVDTRRRVWLADSRSTASGPLRVLGFDAAGTCLTPLTGAPDDFAPAHIRVDHRQRLWAAEPQRGRLSIFSIAADTPRLLGTLEAADLELPAFAPRRVHLHGGRLMQVLPTCQRPGGWALHVWTVADA